MPELYNRLLAVEERMESILKGPCWDEVEAPTPKMTPEDLEVQVTAEDREETGMVCASLDDTPPSPVRATMTPAELVAVSPARRRNSVKITDFSRAKMSDMSEKILEMHTTEYYKWGVAWCFLLGSSKGARSTRKALVSKGKGCKMP